MKKTICLLLCLLLLSVLVACGKTEAPNKPDVPATPGTTLMIYMVGSDLEAKGGSATKDMEEIIKSQVDLSKNNVLLYAGGTKRWHNDFLSADKGHGILKLTADGFLPLEVREEVSMGEADTLAYFLNYAYENYKTQAYALILWDHGNGPLIGYGKDMLHEDDSLTLLEMQDALRRSPFKDGCKLDWVGFDACLMSSVELACIFQDHADYLIASQEVEPSFGWNYGFLQQLGQTDTKTLAGEITKQYLDTCLAYYEKRNFDQRDTTLACLELAKFTPLKTALETLFSKAAQDVTTSYSQLVATRVNTRALGRATTGSEYDLIDLMDMATQLKTYYPAEAEAILTAAKDMVVHNATNAENCCGLSLYYPFYNKSYYEKAWSNVYEELNALPAYVTYLKAYAQRWLQNDLMQTTASSIKPQALSANQFTLSLTQAQADNFADASYYILQREGDQLYTRLHTSSNVKKEGNALIANFDGNILYAKNNFNEYWIPAIDEHDTVGDYTRYSTYLNLTNGLPTFTYKPEGYEKRVEGHRFHISVNNVTREIKTAALVPYSTDVQTQTLVGGKQEDADLSVWSEYYFLCERHLYLRRDEKGTILPLDQWEASAFLSANVSRVGDGIDFVMAPIPEGEYYLIYEIEDVQGNRYCSEPLPIQSQGLSLPEEFQEENANVRWDSGDRAKLFEQAGIIAYLTTVEDHDAVRFALQIENNNDFAVTVLGHELMYNNYYHCPDGLFGYFTILPGETVTEDISFGAAEELEMLQELKSLQLSLSVVTATGDRTLIWEKPVNLELSAQTAALRKDYPEDSFFASNYYKVQAPACGLQAGNQTLFNQNGLQCTLLGLGGNGTSEHMVLNFRFENASDQVQNFRINGVIFDNVFVTSGTGPVTVYPGTAIYKTYSVGADDLALHQITSASKVSLSVSFMEFATLMGGGGFSQTMTFPVNLSVKGTPTNFKLGSTLLYQDSEVRIYLNERIDEYGDPVWICTLINSSNRDLLLGTSAATINGKTYATDSLSSPILLPYDTRCPAGLVTAFEVKYYGDETGALKISFKPQFYDIDGEELFREGTEITLQK